MKSILLFLSIPIHLSEALVVPPTSILPKPSPLFPVSSSSSIARSLSMTINDNYYHQKNQETENVHIKNKNKNNINSRKAFLHQTLQSTAIIATTFAATSTTNSANAFDGGVGGLGKTKPSTGVVFANPESVEDASNTSTPGDYNAELLSPDGSTPAFLSFYAPWPMLKSSGIESRDLANSESAFVQVVPVPEGKEGISTGNLPKSFFVNSIFNQTGKYGMYGTPTDIKVSKLQRDGNASSSNNIYVVSFTTLTPAMRESDRKVYISVSPSVIGNGIFMLVTGTTLTRFKSQDSLLKQVAESFVCVEAPKSSLRR